MTKHEKKVLEVLNAIIDNRIRAREAREDEHEKECLNVEIATYHDCIYLLIDNKYLNDMSLIYESF